MNFSLQRTQNLAPVSLCWDWQFENETLTSATAMSRKLVAPAGAVVWVLKMRQPEESRAEMRIFVTSFEPCFQLDLKPDLSPDIALFSEADLS